MINKHCLVIDHGLFLPLALRLAEDFERVSYYTPDTEIAFPVINNALIGDGFSEIKRCDDLWSAIKDVDLFVFPDVQHSSLQLHLESLGKRVWGSRNGDSLELKRVWFKSLQKKLGMQVSPHKIIHGLTDLRAYLAEHPGTYVKVSRWRGLTETFCYHDDLRGRTKLDTLAVKLGPVQDDFPFLVEDPIEAIIEIGIDEFCVDGQFPKTVVQGPEGKDKTYIGVVTPVEELPDELRQVNEFLAPFFAEQRYRNFFSAEVRIKDDHTSYLTDPTCRHASPAGECLLELIGNLGEILWEGAQGNLVEPEYRAKFAVQAMVDHPDDEDHWRVLEWHNKPWFKPFAAVAIGDHLAFPPLPWSNDAIGSLVGIGDTIEDALESLKESAKPYEDQGMTVHIPDIASTLKNIHEAEKQGVEISPEPVPEPESVVDA